MKTNKPRFFPQGFLAGCSETLHMTAGLPVNGLLSVTEEAWSVGRWQGHLPPIGSNLPLPWEKGSSVPKTVNLGLCSQGCFATLSICRFWGRNGSVVGPQTMFTHEIYFSLNCSPCTSFCTVISDLRPFFRYICIVM